MPDQQETKTSWWKRRDPYTWADTRTALVIVVIMSAIWFGPGLFRTDVRWKTDLIVLPEDLSWKSELAGRPSMINAMVVEHDGFGSISDVVVTLTGPFNLIDSYEATDISSDGVHAFRIDNLYGGRGSLILFGGERPAENIECRIRWSII